MQTLQLLTTKLKLDGFGRGVWAVAAMYVAGNSGFATAAIYLPLYLYQERQIPMTVVGLIFLATGISGSVANIIGGITGDRFGYRRMITVYLSAAFLATAWQAVLIGMEAPVWSIMLITVLARVLGSMAGPSFNAIIANASPKDRMTESYSLLSVAVGAGWTIGPVLGGYLLGFISFGWLIGIGTGMQALQLIGIPFLPRDADKSNSERLTVNSLKALIHNKTLIIFSLLNLVFFLATAQWGGTLSVFTVDRIGFTKEQYGLLMSATSLLVVIFQYPVSRWVQLANPRKVLVPACLIYAAGFLSFSWVEAFLPAIGSAVILIAAEMLFIPTALGVVGRISRPEDRGKSMGIYGLCQGLGFSLGGLLGGFLLDQFPTTPLYLWGIVSICPLIAALGFAIWKGYLKEQEHA